MGLKFQYVKLLSHLPGASELMFAVSGADYSTPAAVDMYAAMVFLLPHNISIASHEPHTYLVW